MAATTEIYILENRADTKANFEKSNLILGKGEFGVVVDTTPVRAKIGDGVTPWNSMPYVIGTNLLNANINASGELILTLLDNQTINCGKVRGADGKDGKDGTDGADGAAATITIGTVTTGAPGSSVIVENVGTSSAAVLNITIPHGTPGAAYTPPDDTRTFPLIAGGTPTKHFFKAAKTLKEIIILQSAVATATITVNIYGQVLGSTTVTTLATVTIAATSPAVATSVDIADVAIAAQSHVWADCADLKSGGKTNVTVVVG